MSLRPALLALISSGPMTGYDAVKWFRGTVGHLWQAPDSQIYPALRAMSDEGLLSAHPVPWGSKGATKTQYEITDQGREALRRWQTEPVAYAAERDAAHLKAAYFEWGTPQDARRHLEHHAAHYAAVRDSAVRQIREIRDGSSETVTRRLTRTPDAQRPAVIAFKVLAYEGKIARAEAEISWARRGLEVLDDLAAPAGSGDVVDPGTSGPQEER